MARQAEGAGETEVMIKATQAEIAQLAGTSRESASRFLATLEREGVVATRARQGTVHEPAACGTSSTERAAPPARRRMVERQLHHRGIGDQRVLHAMSVVPRERFVPEEQRYRAYRDSALSIGEGQTISQPWIVARMAELLALQGRERVLEVGTGSGYAAAVLSLCAAQVVSIERVRALAGRPYADAGRARLRQRRGLGGRRLPGGADTRRSEGSR